MIRRLLGLTPPIPKPKLSSFVMVTMDTDGAELDREVIRLSAVGVNRFLDNKGPLTELYTMQTGVRL